MSIPRHMVRMGMHKMTGVNGNTKEWVPMVNGTLWMVLGQDTHGVYMAISRCSVLLIQSLDRVGGWHEGITRDAHHAIRCLKGCWEQAFWEVSQEGFPK